MNRYIQTLTWMLAAWLTASNGMAQEQNEGEQQNSGSGSSSKGVCIHGNVYGGGNLADVQTNTEVNMSTGQVMGNVYGGGRGSADNYSCDKAMVGINNEGAGQEPSSDGNKDKGTKVTITGGTVGTLSSGTLVDGTGNVYGGGEIGRVEWNTQVTIGAENQTEGANAPIIHGSVFGAGAGNETHGFAALVRGNCTVTMRGTAWVKENVYGGGEMATAGRYWVTGAVTPIASGETKPDEPADLPSGMPYATRGGGVCTVIVQDNVKIGPDVGASLTAGHVFGAGKGINPHYSPYNAEDLKNSSRRMADTNEWVYFTDDTEEVEEALRKTGKEKYLQFLQTLALATETHVTIGGGSVKGNVYGGSESGFVQDDTEVQMSNGTIGATTYGHVFGGGKGLADFAEAGKVKGNTGVAISGNAAVNGNVYGGGELGDIGTITKPADYNYTWKQNDGTNANVGGTNAMTSTNNNTGVCTVTITGGTIGSAGAVDESHGNVFGAGRGLDDTFWCEKAIAYATAVSITGGTVYGNVYGGGQIGRVEDDAKVTIGGASTEVRADIKGSVFGAGAGVETHGYSALVRGNTTVTVEGNASVAHSVYGGGEIASVGKYGLDAKKMPSILQGGGYCYVTVRGHANIAEDVFGAGQGVTPHFDNDDKDHSKRSRRMTVYNSKDFPDSSGPNGSGTWEYYENYPNNYSGTKFVWDYYQTSESYSTYLETLALATHPEVTIDGDATVNGSVFGGGELGLTKGSVIVKIKGGTIAEDVYGGGSLANTNTTSTVDLDGDGETEIVHPTTTVNLLGGLIKGDAYGGGLGQKNGFNGATSDIAATVYGDINVTLNGTKFNIDYDTTTDQETDDEGNILKDENDNTVYVKVVKSGRVFGCNNLLGSPQGNVTVTVYKTVAGNTSRTTAEAKANNKTLRESHPNGYESVEGYVPPTYEVAAVYGGGNLAPFTTAGKKAHVIIHGCGDTSIETVYGGGNAAPVPETQVDVYATYEIENLFGGGNGKDKYKNDSGWQTNPGADINGNTNTIIYGGTVHEAYGGSNEKGTIHGDVAIDVSESTGNESCPLDVAKLVGAGKNADVNGDLIMVMGCKPLAKIPLLFAGADNANVNGDVELTITSGNFGQVFGGNNAGGAIYGHIKLNIEETGDCETPITIDSLYLGGNQAAYSVYGYKTEDGKLVPQSADELRAAIATDPANEGKTPEEKTTLFNSAKYEDPELNIVACTYIGQVFGGGYGTGAYMYADPKVNINMIQGSKHSGVPIFMTTDPRVKDLGLSISDNPNHLGIIGTVYGGGNAADVYGDPTVNICTASTVDLVSTGATGNTVLGAYIVGSVFGGGKGKADTYTCEKAMVGIDGDGVDNPDGGTTVNIYNGTVLGSVYGGGEIGRVEKNTMVTIGQGDGISSGTPTSAPVVKGNVFGAGKGLETHGYAALVRGNPTVTIQGNAKVLKSVYGGGEIASVARYDVVDGVPVALAQVKEGQHSGWCTVNVRGYAEIGPETEMKMYHEGVPEVDDAPDDAGHVFAAGRGVLPENYTYDDNEHRPKRMLRYDSETIGKITYWKYAKTYPADYSGPKDIWQYFKDEDEYFDFIQTLALATQTSATIGGNALVKGSVYGGSENGLVQYDTNVTIEGDCQIGCGKNTTGRHPDPVWDDDYTVPDDGTDLECASWEYDGKTGAPYDPYAIYKKDGKYYYDEACTNYADGGAKIAKDGHTYYGNVFGGGSGSVPYFDTNKHESRYIMTAGWVKGNTHVTINGGHILTNVYGGCEATNVDGTATVTMTSGTVGVPRTLEQIVNHPLTCYLFGAGKGDQRVFYNKSTNVKDVEVRITGGRIYGSVFGGGEDGHVLRNVTMTIGQQSTTGEGTEAVTTTSGPTIGTWGTSYVDGNVFGGGRGFGGDAYTAGNVAGSVKMEIKGGSILGSIYGGGRLGSVGYGLFDEGVSGYGEMRKDSDTEDGFTDGSSNFFTKGRGHIDITISGGTIGNTLEYIVPNATNIAAASISKTDISKWTATEWSTWKTYHHIPKTEFDAATGHLTHTKGGNVFAGGMGRFYQLDGTTPISVIDWWKLGNVKSTKLTITGGIIKSNVYGGGELGQTVGHHTTQNANFGTEITIQGSSTQIGTEVTNGEVTEYTFGSVFGGGYGSLLETITVNNGTSDITSYPKFIAGLVKEDTKIDMQNGAVKASIYGGGEMASVGESTTSGETTTATGSTYVYVSDGTVGIAPIEVSEGTKRYFGGAKMGNVYGGGSGHNNTVRSGRIFKNSNVTISGGMIYHNVYGGGAYGTVGDFNYKEAEDPETQTQKVSGVNSLNTADTGVATVTITGGTIGSDGKENGMVFGSSRGDIAEPGKRDDHAAWVYDANVIIGTAATPASGTEEQEGYVPATPASGPDIKGSVYGSGENGHTFNNTVVMINGGTIGIADKSDPGYTIISSGTTYEGAAYPYRGNVYGSGCGTDKYYSDATGVANPRDGNGDTYNPLSGIVYGTTTVNINGGQVARNVYGAGAMGSVGKATTTNNVTTVSGGTTTINVSGGTVGVDGTNGDGNVFGAARGDASATINQFALVRKSTNVSVTGGTIKGNIYGGGELGSVGTFTVSNDMRTFTWTDTDGTDNTANNEKNTGVCHVTVNGSSADINGKVFGGGKGLDDTFWCEKGIAYSTKVNIVEGTVTGNVYGGGEVGRVETDSYVKIGDDDGTAEGTSTPSIMGSVFGGGAGVETHGYSALVRGNTTVIVEGNASVAHSVYGGGEIASVGKYGLDAKKMPSILQGGGYCYVTVRGHANIAEDVFGAGQGVTPHFDNDDKDHSKRSRRMTVYNSKDFPDSSGPNGSGTWEYYENYPNNYSGTKFVWDYYQTSESYSTYLETLALATHPEVTIDGDATVNGSVFGGGELGLTKGSVIVKIKGGTIAEDVYGGGSLANTNTTSTVDLDGDGETETVDPTTTVSLTGGTINRNVYGGGLGRLAKEAVAAQEAQGTEGEEGYVPAVEAKDAVSAVEAKVYGDVLVELNKTTDTDNCEVQGIIFGCNNLNGSPQAGVTVHVHKTVAKDNSGKVKAKPTKDNNKYELTAVYGGGNLAAFYPDDATTRATAKANVIIDGCGLTSIETVYGGGNAASVPETDVVINGTYEIGQAFGGGNGADEYVIDGKTYENPGANVGYMSYAYHTWDDMANKYIAHEYTDADGTDKDASTKDKRVTNYGTDDNDSKYGTGKAHVTVKGGTVHEVYAGSNTRGNIRVESRATLVDADDNDCDFDVTDAYGGGRNALQDGDAILDIGCISGLGKAYGGASNADVNGDVILNITNGTYGQVFGGNDMGGCIRGSITVNVEETGCLPVIIGELYGGGNKAAYSVYGYNDDGTLKTNGTAVTSPTVNVRSFTSIGRIFGGGYGEEATMVGDPTVNINVVKGKYENDERTVIGEGARVIGSHWTTNTETSGYKDGYPIPSHEKNKIGSIKDVFGGGNQAEVIGTPHVMVGTQEYVEIVTASGNVTGYYTRTGEGTYTEATTSTATGNTKYYKKVEGVDIRGNVYGGGNNANVTGDTKVVIGKKAE